MIHTNLSDIEKLALKQRLMKTCAMLIEGRVTENNTAMQNAQQAANAGEKSSAGDKFETSRAMHHLEKEMHGRQLAANRLELSTLSGIDCSTLHVTAAKGSFIQCGETCFFIAAGLGKVQLEALEVYLLSPLAPVAGLLFGRQAGDTILFNKREMIITAIF